MQISSLVQKRQAICNIKDEQVASSGNSCLIAFNKNVLVNQLCRSLVVHLLWAGQHKIKVTVSSSFILEDILQLTYFFNLMVCLFYFEALMRSIVLHVWLESLTTSVVFTIMFIYCIQLHYESFLIHNSGTTNIWPCLKILAFFAMADSIRKDIHHLCWSCLNECLNDAGMGKCVLLDIGTENNWKAVFEERHLGFALCPQTCGHCEFSSNLQLQVTAMIWVLA